MAIPFIMINLDKPRKLRFGMGAMVEFEQLTGIKLMELNDEMSMDVCSKILWIMLKQEDKELTLEKTCELIDEYAESITEVITAITRAIEAAFQKETGHPNVNPPKK
ncbi:hypothetical protein [Gudongella oleilytica]|uniref:hypothetical protein n=1 Tax=Gudongella oleilytica TaxID=1582259 RepID=UPI000FF88732|nr:hypothetical protein [Gudongella oleilytica]